MQRHDIIVRKLPNYTFLVLIIVFKYGMLIIFVKIASIPPKPIDTKNKIFQLNA